MSYATTKARACRRAVFAAVTAWGVLAPGWSPAQQGREVSTPQAQTEKAPPEATKPKPAEPALASLQELLTQALKNNPDLRVAETKLREAEAELHRARLQVTQKVITVHQALERQRALVELSKKQLDRLNALRKTNAIDTASLEEGERTLADAKAKLTDLEAELAYVLGKQTVRQDAAAALSEWILAQPQRPPQSVHLDPQWFQELSRHIATKPGPVALAPGSMADKIRKALDTPVTVDFKNQSLEDVLKHLQKETDIPIVVAVKRGQPITLRVEQKLPLVVVFQLLEDWLPDVVFAVRDYGVLATVSDRLPPGTTSVHNFWKAARPGTGEKAPPAGSKH